MDSTLPNTAQVPCGPGGGSGGYRGPGVRRCCNPLQTLRKTAVSLDRGSGLPGFLGGRLQQLCEGGHWVADDQPFFLRASLLGLPLGRLDFGHDPSDGIKEVPPPGIGPGRPGRSPACKAGLSTKFQHGGTRENVGSRDGGSPKLSTRLGLIQANRRGPQWVTRYPSPLAPSRDNRDQVRCKLPRLGQSGVSQPIPFGTALADHDGVSVAPELLQHSIDSSDRCPASRLQAAHQIATRVVGLHNG